VWATFRTFPRVLALRLGPHDARSPHRGIPKREGQPVQGEDLVMPTPLRVDQGAKLIAFEWHSLPFGF